MTHLKCPLSVGDAVEAFEQDYWQRRAKSPKSATTWEVHYSSVFRRLPLDEFLTAELLLEAVIAIAPDTCQRKRFCHVLTCLANFCGVSVDLSRYAGNYNSAKTAPRSLPTDSEIVHIWQGIESPSWQWAFGLLAAYGLRPHELFFIDGDRLSSGDVCLNVLDETKTGSRLVFPFHPEWFDRFQLSRVEVPKCTGKNNRDLGSRVCKAFKRYKITFPPYHLRHAWAVRSMRCGLDISLASQQMGHSVLVHYRVYHHWISEKIHREAYEKITQRT